MAISFLDNDSGNLTGSATLTVPTYASAADGDILIVVIFNNEGGTYGQPPEPPNDGRWSRLTATGGLPSTYAGDRIQVFLTEWSTTTSDDPIVFTDGGNSATADWAYTASWYRADNGFLSPGFCFPVTASYYAEHGSAWGFDDWFWAVEDPGNPYEVGSAFGEYDTVKSTVASADLCVYTFGNDSDDLTVALGGDPTEPTNSTLRGYASEGVTNLSGWVATADEVGSSAVNGDRTWICGYTGSAKSCGIWLREAGAGGGGPFGGFIVGHNAW